MKSFDNSVFRPRVFHEECYEISAVRETCGLEMILVARSFHRRALSLHFRASCSVVNCAMQNVEHNFQLKHRHAVLYNGAICSLQCERTNCGLFRLLHRPTDNAITFSKSVTSDGRRDNVVRAGTSLS